jgi:hypothetical protein
MLDSTGATGGTVRLNERTGRAIFMRAIWFAAVATGGTIAFTIGYGAGSFGVLYWLFLWFVGWSVQFGAVKEWSVDGHKLRCRRWRSRPGSEPTTVLDLGPGVEAIHETWGRWRVWPGGFTMEIEPWASARLVAAMNGAGVRVEDWRGDWTRRHRLLDAAGLLAYYGGAVAVFVAIAFAPVGPGNAPGFAAILLALGLFLAGFAVNFLPWQMSKQPYRGQWHSGPTS